MPVEPLDELADEAAMIKIDVEGFEMEVIQGADSLFKKSSLQAVLIELNGLGLRYGFHDEDIHALLLNFGFTPVSYDPFMRKLTSMGYYKDAGNTLYVRRTGELDRRLRVAQSVVWGKTKF